MRLFVQPNRQISTFVRTLCFLGLGLCLVSPPSTAANLTVDCTGAPPPPGVFGSITAALNSLPLTATAEIHVLTVTGTCVENVMLFRVDNITIQAPVGQTATVIGDPNTPANGVFDLVSARFIMFQRLIIQGGGSHGPQAGVNVSINSFLLLEDCTVEGANGSGVFVSQGSLFHMVRGTIRNNGGSGVLLDSGTAADLNGIGSASGIQIHNNGGGVSAASSSLTVQGPVTIENNGGPGVSLSRSQASFNAAQDDIVVRGNLEGIDLVDHSAATVSGQLRIESNQGIGLLALDGSSANLQRRRLPSGVFRAALIEGNQFNGIVVAAQSVVRMNGPHKIRNNSLNDTLPAGIFVVRNSTLRAGNGVEIANNQGPGILAEQGANLGLNNLAINNNMQEGVRLLRMSVGDLLVGNTIAGNGGASITCDSTALVVGDVSGISNINCNRIEREVGPPRAGRVH
jgi:hypothetical protein